MQINDTDERYPELKAEFSEIFVYLFDVHGNLNCYGKIAGELLHLRAAANEYINHADNVGSAGWLPYDNFREIVKGA